MVCVVIIPFIARGECWLGGGARGGGLPADGRGGQEGRGEGKVVRR